MVEFGIELDIANYPVTSASILAAYNHTKHDYKPLMFISHLTDVAHFTQWYTDNQEVIAAAWMHDLVEDTNVTLEQMKAVGFSELTVSIVDLLTDPLGASRQEMKEEMYQRYVRQDEYHGTVYEWARIVKCCDRLANMQFSFRTNNIKKVRMYVREWFDFNEFICHDSKGEHLAIPEHLFGELTKAFMLANELIDRNRA